MKKLLALLLALMMALSCTLALAEDASEAFPGVTIASTLNIDQDTVMQLLPMFGVEEEETLQLAKAVIALINAMEEKLVVCGNGIQYDIGFNGKNALSLAGTMDDAGIVLVSTLFPSYQLTLSTETLMTLLEGAMANFGVGEDGPGFDVEALAEKLGGYFEEYITACVNAVTMGEPETGDYVMDGHSFNVMTPITVDTKAILEAAQNLLKQLSEDEAFQAALQAAGVDASELPAAMDQNLNEEAIVDVKGEVYRLIDENGNQGDEVLVIVNVYAADSQDPATVVDVLVTGENVQVNVSIPEAQTNVSVFVMPNDSGFNARADIYANEAYFGVGFDFSMDDSGALVGTNLYFLDTDKPIASASLAVYAGGELTMSMDAGDKTVLSIEELMGEGADEAMSGLRMDVLLNGVMGGLIGSITEAVPEAGNLMSGLLGSLTGMAG